MKLQEGTIVRMTEEQAESLTTLVKDQIEDLRHCIKKQGELKNPDLWLTICLIRFVTHYRNIKKTLNDLHYLNPEATKIINSSNPVERYKHTGVFFR